MQLLSLVSEQKKMKAAFRHSRKAALVAGYAAVIGGLMAGPPGIAAGGAIGGLLGALTSGQFKPIPQIILEMSPAEKQQIYKDVCAIIQNLDWNDIAELTALVLSSSSIQKKLLDILANYITTELKGKVQYGK
ncbi:putative Protein C19orf12-like protein [Naja naja]|nr:putative Protein C19orf12-like protein [Naja naja]